MSPEYQVSPFKKELKKEKLSSIMKEQKIRRLIPLPSQKKDCSMSSKKSG
jgi:hypothetical protein